MKYAASEGVAFLVTPEGSLSGYTSNFDQEQLQNALSEVESSAELWAFSLKIPILEINASCNEQPVNARSGFFVTPVKRSN